MIKLRKGPYREPKDLPKARAEFSAARYALNEAQKAAEAAAELKACADMALAAAEERFKQARQKKTRVTLGYKP